VTRASSSAAPRGRLQRRDRDTLAGITAASVEHNSLPRRELMLARLAALIAVDAPPASYLANAQAAQESGVTADDIQAVMIGGLSQ
jgi:hypothetical protein